MRQPNVQNVTLSGGAPAEPAEAPEVLKSAAEQGRLIRELAFECINRASRRAAARLADRAVGFPG